MRIKTVLCAVDRSPISERAMAYATAVARQFVARLSVLEVVDCSLPPIAGTTGEFIAMPPELQAEVLAHLNRLAAPARESGIATEVGVHTGAVVRQILSRATDVAADLVVVGTHGRGGFERLALGSVAEKILRKAPCSVLTVPPGAGTPTDAPFSSIVCAIDLSEASADVFRVATALATHFGSHLHVVRAVDWPFGDVTGNEQAAALQHSLETRARDQLTALMATAELPATRVSTSVVAGVPRRAILDCARERRADLIVMGVSGHGAIDRALLGSTTHGVVRESTCPVLTAR